MPSLKARCAACLGTENQEFIINTISPSGSSLCENPVSIPDAGHEDACLVITPSCHFEPLSKSLLLVIWLSSRFCEIEELLRATQTRSPTHSVLGSNPKVDLIFLRNSSSPEAPANNGCGRNSLQLIKRTRFRVVSNKRYYFDEDQDVGGLGEVRFSWLCMIGIWGQKTVL